MKLQYYVRILLIKKAKNKVDNTILYSQEGWLSRGERTLPALRVGFQILGCSIGARSWGFVLSVMSWSLSAVGSR